ncbi:MAG: prolyl oligopeptidase family serine peptidase, partial [Siphonobacter aquaeclarae]|nr:prolyl oligopeptidase family serine peptidase [Siphonobacter aquaeclarae]
HQIYLIRSSPADQLQPKLETRNYLKPGDALPVHQPVLFLVDDKRAIPLDMSLFREQFSLSRPEWRKDGRAFTFEFNERGHQTYRVLEADGTTGRVRAIIEEKSPTFIDYSGKKYREDLGDGAEIVWASERDGWNHLYLFDGKTGKIKKQITRGEWVVRRVFNVDEKSRTILFAASGRNPGEDPYLLHYYRIKLDGTGLTDLTPEPANHGITLADSIFLDTYSRADMAPVTVLRRLRDGSVIRELERADISAYEKAGWKMPEVFSAKGRDGQTDIWGIIIRPTDFDPSKKYPVIENIYAGPHSAFVPKSFLSFTAMHELAELGFIVVQIDGMGTSNRSKAFHDICWKNLKDAGFPDRIKWMEAAAQKYPSVDLSRVGLYGTSAGGQSAAGGLLFHPDFYKVAVASCGCHDNRMDKIWWNEQWMGYPIGPHYAECSNVVNAGKLKGELLLLVGEMDDNVDPSSTYQFADALIKANKNFDLVVLPGVGHSSGGAFGERKRRDFFVRHLLGFQPPAWNALIPNP